MWVCICLLLALLRLFLQTCTPVFRTAVVTLYLADSLLSLLPQLYETITVTIIMLQVVYVTLVFPCDESICCCFLKYC